MAGRKETGVEDSRVVDRKQKRTEKGKTIRLVVR